MTKEKNNFKMSNVKQRRFLHTYISKTNEKNSEGEHNLWIMWIDT